MCTPPGNRYIIKTSISAILGQDFIQSHMLTYYFMKQDLFCGGGSLGRGLEEGGHIIKNICAVDINVAAMHTYRANLTPQNRDCHLYLGSVNDFLEKAIKGELEEKLRPENIDFLAAGSPCQGMIFWILYILSTISVAHY